MSAEEKPDPQFKMTQSDNCVQRYVDVCIVSGSLYGFELHMGKRGKEEPMPEHVINLVAHMSPQHAKDLACILLDNITSYEKKFGKINSQFDIKDVQIRKREDAGGPTFTPPGDIQA